MLKLRTFCGLPKGCDASQTHWKMFLINHLSIKLKINTKNNENSENNENVGDNENSGGGENDVNNIRKTKYVDKTPLPYLDDVKLFLANKLKKVDRTRDVKNTDNLLSTLKKRLENNRHYISNE